MEKMIYDAEQHIDFGVIEKILKENYDKKIVCFGGGPAADILMKRFLKNYKIECFIDNDESLHEKNIYGISIKSPKIIPKMKKGSFIILILSRHLVAISEQLKEYGLRENKDFYDIYSKFFKYFRIKKYEDNARKFLEFIDRIHDNEFDSKNLKQGQQKIGIVCLGEMIQNVTWYSMAQSILLRYNGYSSTLIIDTMGSFDSYIYFDGIEDVARIYIDYVLKYLLAKCPDIDVKYVDEYGEAELDEEDIKMTEKDAPLVVKWFDSQKDEVFLKNNSERVDVAKKLLQKTMKNIKAFFEKNQYDTINVYTGIHRHRCVYTYIGHKNGVRVSTYDEGYYSHDGVSTHFKDITDIITNNILDKKTIATIIKKTKDIFDKRVNHAVGKWSVKRYDIVIPLNISWDSSALAMDDVFKDDITWLQETLEFLMKNTNSTVAIRVHPAQNCLKEYNYINYEKELPIINRYSKRIDLVKADDDINTYSLLKKAKIILPYSSTTGVEAAILGKNVILHTNVYYKDLKIAYKAQNKAEYFEKIVYYLENTEKKICEDINYAYLILYLILNYTINTDFEESKIAWMEKDITELNSGEGVKIILQIIAEGVPGIIIKLTKSKE